VRSKRQQGVLSIQSSAANWRRHRRTGTTGGSPYEKVSSGVSREYRRQIQFSKKISKEKLFTTVQGKEKGKEIKMIRKEAVAVPNQNYLSHSSPLKKQRPRC
jgi:hypothetical protein